MKKKRQRAYVCQGVDVDVYGAERNSEIIKRERRGTLGLPDESSWCLFPQQAGFTKF